MKKNVYLIPLIVILGCGKSLGYEPPVWKVTAKVIDEQNQPVINANTKIWWHIPAPEDQSIAMTNIAGLTDSNGVFVIIQRSGSIEVICEAAKDGYYGCGRTHEFQRFNDNDPAKWNPTITLLLKKVGHPIPMYAKQTETKVQKEDEPMGFDLMAGDWVAPFGKGKEVDMLFTVRRRIFSQREYDCDLKLTFPNKGDGIAVAPPERQEGSGFRTSRSAVEMGYEPSRIWHYGHTNQTESVFGYSFRVRTVLDENGKVKSALYGKIRGDFRFYAGTQVPHAGIGFDYYLNPTPNDRNLEFDPRQNLMKDLKSDEEIREP